MGWQNPPLLSSDSFPCIFGAITSNRHLVEGRAANIGTLGEIKVIFRKHYCTKCNGPHIIILPQTPAEVYMKMKKHSRKGMAEIVLVGSWEGSPCSL